MAVPVVASFTTYAPGTSGSTASVTAPANVAANDIVLILLYVENQSTISPPSGFQSAPSSPAWPTTGTNRSSLHVFWKRSTGSEPSTYSISLVQSTVRRAAALRISGVVTTGDPWDASDSATDTSTSAGSTPAVSISTTGVDRLAILLGGSADVGAWNTPPSSFVEQYPASITTTSEMAWASRTVASATTLSSLTWASGDASAKAAWVGALIPARVTHRFYLTNTPAAYVRGAASTLWGESAAAKATPLRLGTEPAGPLATRSVTETAPGEFWVCLAQFMSGPATAAGDVGDVITLTFGRQESSAAANLEAASSIWILKPDGGLRSFVINGGWVEEYTTIPTAESIFSGGTRAAVEVGDRLIVEVGFTALNAEAAAHTGTMWHGSTSPPDLVFESTDLDHPGWIDVTVSTGVTFAADPPTVAAGADVASHLPGVQFSRTATEGYGGAAVTDRSWTIEAGPDGDGTEIGTAAALTWTPTVVGQYTLRYSSTNSAGTGFDEITVNVAAPVGLVDVAVEGPEVGARNVVGAWPDTADILVEAVPVTLTKYLDLEEPPAVGVQAPSVEVSHLVHADDMSDIVVEGLPIKIAGQLDRGDIEVQGTPIQVSYSSRGTGGLSGIDAVPDAPTTRFIVQSVLTGQFLHWDLPITNPTVTLTLSGPTSITGDLEPEDPEIRDLLAAGLEPWACWIHVETDGLIRASGILQPFQIDDEVLSVEATGPSSYLHGIPYLAELSGIQIDPADVVRAIWAHVQSYPDGQLGVTVNGTTPIRIGEPAYTTPKLDADGNPELDDDGNIVMEEVEAKPYQLVWWEGTDCGAEVDNLAQEAPFDYIERCAWNADRTAVNHWIDLGYPRLGARRDDLRFATGENVTGAVPAEETDDLYASQVVLYGKGEGRDTIRGYAGRPLRKRLRRVAIIQDSTVATAERATAISADDLERRQGLVDVTDLEVEARHLNAEFGTYAPGDDILIDVEVGWLGRLRQYERILSVTYAPDGEAVRLQLRRAEAFRYGGGA